MFDFAFSRKQKILLLFIAGILFFLLFLVGSRMYFEHLAATSKQNENKDEDLTVEFFAELEAASSTAGM